MRYPNSSTRVAARRPSPTESVDDRTRQALRQKGEALDVLLRAEITDIYQATADVIGPRDLYRDVGPERMRAASVVTIGACLAGLARSRSVTARRMSQLRARLLAWFDGLCDDTPGCVFTALVHETEANAAADPDQWLAVRAIEEGDVTAVRRAIDRTARTIAASQQLQRCLEGALAQMQRQRPIAPSRVVVLSAGFQQ